MSAAPYQIDITVSDDETFEFTLPLEMTDGSPWPWADYRIEYALGAGGCQHVTASSVTTGVVLDPQQGRMTIAPPGLRLAPGRYEHACRARHVATGKLILIFDGSVVVTCEPFRQ